MITTEFYHGQGWGNQLFVYVTTRAIAADKGVDFGFTGVHNFGDRRYNDKGVYFMDIDLGKELHPNQITEYYREKEMRIRLNNSHHDATIGCDIRLFDKDLTLIPNNCKIDGIMQSEDYFYHRKSEIKQWLKVKPEHDCRDFISDDICVINFRDYRGNNELHLNRNYWAMAVYHMLNINSNMQFLVITESPEAAKEMLPELAENTYHFDLAKDYSIIKNARWLILSNSSFAYFPAMANEEARLIIAPKYWARHNVSDGYWSCGYNIYRDFNYMDREGRLQTYNECLREFELYKNQSKIYG